jgi:hypothetical protein
MGSGSLRCSPPVRPAGGHFHLLAQMKVTKAKCLKFPFDCLTWQQGSTFVSPSYRGAVAHSTSPQWPGYAERASGAVARTVSKVAPSMQMFGLMETSSPFVWLLYLGPQIK